MLGDHVLKLSDKSEEREGRRWKREGSPGIQAVSSQLLPSLSYSLTQEVIHTVQSGIAESGCSEDPVLTYRGTPPARTK